MKLVCPNCGAQYEVPDNVIPDAGREVQCSNCGDAWFQPHPSQDRDLAEELQLPVDDAWQEEDDRIADAEPDFEPAAPPQEEVYSDVPAAPDTANQSAQSEATQELQPRGLAPDVADILREEAAFEAEARAADVNTNVGGIETQPDLGLQDPPPSEISQREREARLRMAKMRGQSEAQAVRDLDADAHAAPATRRDLLPDIEEINSTLRKSSDRHPMETDAEIEPAAPPSKSGFRRGFLWIIILAVTLICIYVYASQIAKMIPQLSGVLKSYVALVDQARMWLDGQVTSLMQWLDSKASGATSSAPAVENIVEPAATDTGN